MNKVREYLLSEIERRGSIHITLLDPDRVDIDTFLRLGKLAEESGSSALMVGGSLGVTESLLDEYVRELKRTVSLPVILFPGSIAGLSRYADAVWFLVVLNSSNTYYIVDAQVQASVLLYKRYRNLEVLPLAYIIVGEGGTVGLVSQARVLPYEKPEVILGYVLLAKYVGFPFTYLEAGSGAKMPVPPEIVSMCRSVYDGVLIVGGGIRDEDTAYRIARAGADIVVTGTLVERNPDKLSKIVKAVWRGGNERKEARNMQSTVQSKML